MRRKRSHFQRWACVSISNVCPWFLQDAARSSSFDECQMPFLSAREADLGGLLTSLEDIEALWKGEFQVPIQL
jgi:hypothetical protein